METPMKQVQLIQITFEQLRDSLTANILDALKDKTQRPTAPKNEEYLTREETANLLKINKSTLWSYTKQGKLNAYSIGNRVYYKRSEVDKSFTRLIY
jgi:excisionase family DNA binding protein